MTAPRIETIVERKLVGMRIRMSLSDNKTTELWQKFMPQRKEIKNNLNSRFFSIENYDPSLDFNEFDSNTTFEKWAAIEVTDFNQVPKDMDSHLLSGGKYAVFIHKGVANAFPKTFQHIFGVWLPNSEYRLDNREHFEIMEENYRPDDPNAVEEVWIPIK
jgi:AraC family transcriptional regulator